MSILLGRTIRFSVFVSAVFPEEARFVQFSSVKGLIKISRFHSHEFDKLVVTIRYDGSSIII